ncbi:UNVERIFIED_CONTAM: hypothetical protein NCL1_23308 [Trichonephila clavipes]
MHLAPTLRKQKSSWTFLSKSCSPFKVSVLNLMKRPVHKHIGEKHFVYKTKDKVSIDKLNL